MTPSTCTNCGTDVLEAQDSQGQPVLLHPTPSRSPLAPVAARRDALKARYLKPGEEPAPGEERWMPHVRLCAGRGGANGAWREAQAARAAEGRTARRSRGRGAHSGGWSAGLRVWPTGRHR